MTIFSNAFVRARHAFQSSFIRSVAMLAGGTAAAQLIWFVATPLLTRIYSPADFSVFGAFIALMSMLSIGACLGYDNAVVVAENDDDAAAVLVLSLVLAAVTGILVAAVVLWAPPSFMHTLGALGPYAWTVPPLVFLAAAFSAVQFWASRRRQFANVSRARVIQATAGVATQLGAGLAGYLPLGLVAGQAVNFLLGVVLLGGRMFGEVRLFAVAVRRRSLWRAARTYRNFALMTTPALFANSAGVQVPMLVLASSGKAAEAGFLFLAMRVMQAPLATIGSAVSQVYYSEAPQAWREGRLPQVTSEVISRLAQVGLGPILFAGMVGRPVFEIVFGSGWGRAGEIVAWMVPWLALQFLASPISMSLYAMERQRTDLALQLFGMGVRVGPVLVAASIAPTWLSEVFAVTGAVFYAVYMFALCRVVGISWRDLLLALEGAKWPVLAWFVLGLGVLTILQLLGLVHL